MSGGYFEYNQHHIIDILEKVNELHISDFEETDSKLEDDIEHLRDLLEECYTRTQRLDWLLSGDDGLETYHERLTKELKTHVS